VRRRACIAEGAYEVIALGEQDLFLSLSLVEVNDLCHKQLFTTIDTRGYCLIGGYLDGLVEYLAHHDMSAVVLMT
jgi:hypothetical protein